MGLNCLPGSCCCCCCCCRFLNFQRYVKDGLPDYEKLLAAVAAGQDPKAAAAAAEEEAQATDS